MSRARGHSLRSTRRGSGAFSLIELAIVVCLISLIGAIAVPKMSRGAQGANDSAFVQSLDVLRKAIDLYGAEHAGTYPSVANFKKQLTKYTDANGNISNSIDPAYPYGPYLSDIPSLPSNVGGGGQIATAPGPGVAWVYDPNSGAINANSTASDAAGRAYSAY